MKTRYMSEQCSLPSGSDLLRDFIYTSTGQPCFVKLAYLEYMAYVEVIVHS